MLLVEKIISYYILRTQDLHGKLNFFSVNIITCNCVQLILSTLAPKQISLGLVSCILKDNGSTKT